ncbi:[2Fe-2S] binding domain-containing protein [Seinonella peptonophila]|uniref:[2Fe-2S] binding domain-containing protein n=1 Tax=Seinonella peptonophila TaxID=112248 RepID=A0A1M4YB07_9BACL|nr:2Fe-2S iron-sulfur cluster-binding protein [Seinonella peptonophila]SHF02954.1 [2Fe-2S] binding domain-containing protein [Seinonella peptonophila]
MNGKPIHSCHSLAVELTEKPIITIEGLNDTTVRNEFIDKLAIQCGYCTPGFILNCHALINEQSQATVDTIKDWMPI